MDHPTQHPKKKKFAIYLLFAAIGVALGGAFIAYPKIIDFAERIALDKQNEETMTQILNDGILEKTIENIQNITEQEPARSVVLLENAYLNVPFVCQAPLQTEANWKYHEESCEEAALLQVKYYLDDVNEPDKNKAHEEILNMIDWQEKNFGEHKDLYAADMKDFIKGYYGYTNEEVEIIYDVDITAIKQAISAGYPVITPIMGDILKNPYYPYPGYHMLVIIGYTPDKIITNDNGTRRGKDFSYPYDRFMQALKAAGGDVLIIKKLK
ncbi:C39 family peptidase [Candidatus Peregrinibacteria bacterium]|nr:C39 family peptidase [Candidatus Peregrinibacteria bacterium]